MTCDLCDGRHMVARATTKRRPYRYVLSGLSNVDLIGIEVYRCPGCKVESPIIPRIAELHWQIALWLFSSRLPLSGEQLRYMRKYAGLNAAKLADLLGVRPEHLSRAESGKQPLGEPTERLVRLLCVMARSKSSAQSIYEAYLERDPIAQAVATFEPHAKTWRRV